MERAEVYEQVVRIIHETFDIERERITPEARLVEDLDIDSIDAVDLLVRMKNLTGKRLQPEEFRSVRTIDDVVNALVRSLEVA